MSDTVPIRDGGVTQADCGVDPDEERLIPEGFDFSALSGLSNELKQKLMSAKPRNIAQASRVDGMTPAAISLVLALIKKGTYTLQENLRAQL